MTVALSASITPGGASGSVSCQLAPPSRLASRPAPVPAKPQVKASTGRSFRRAIIASTAETVGELTGYFLGYTGRGLVSQGRIYARLEDWMRRRGWLLLFAVSAVPNPFFGVAGAGPFATRSTIQRGQLLRPFPQFGDIDIRQVTQAKSRYNAMILKLDKRVNNGWGGRFNYTWSNLKDSQFGESNHFSANRTGRPQDNYNLDAEYATSLLDTPHRLVLAPIVELPFGEGKRWATSRVADLLVGGWTFSAVAAFESGFPTPTRYSTGVSLTHLGLFGQNELRPNPTGTDPNTEGDLYDRVGSATPWANAAAYARPAVGQFGTLERTDTRLRTPFRKNLDFVANKAFRTGGYRFDPKWLFHSEIEVEHGSTSTSSGTTTSAGEVSLEFGYLEHLFDDSVSLRTGLVLMPVGLVNEKHEPTEYLPAARSQTETRILPTTWREIGIEGVATFGDFDAKLFAGTGLDGEEFDQTGLRGGRQKGNREAADAIATALRVDWHACEGLLAGSSVVYQKAGQYGVRGAVPIPELDTVIAEGHVDFRSGPWIARALYATVFSDDAQAFAAATGRNLAERSYGAYCEIGCDVATWLFPGGSAALTPFVRYEHIDTQARCLPGGIPRLNYYVGNHKILVRRDRAADHS